MNNDLLQQALNALINAVPRTETQAREQADAIVVLRAAIAQPVPPSDNELKQLREQNTALDAACAVQDVKIARLRMVLTQIHEMDPQSPIVRNSDDWYSVIANASKIIAGKALRLTLKANTESHFDEEPHADLHSECALEISRLSAEIVRLRDALQGLIVNSTRADWPDYIIDAAEEAMKSTPKDTP